MHEPNRRTGCELTVEVGYTDVHEVYSFACEARGDLDVLLFHVEDEREEALDLRWRNIISVGTLDQGLREEQEQHRGNVSYVFLASSSQPSKLDLEDEGEERAEGREGGKEEVRGREGATYFALEVKNRN